MTYQSTITRKGQMTLPKALRKRLGLELGNRVMLEAERGERTVKITPIPPLDSLAGSIKVKKPRNPVSIRKYMERHYRRV